MVGQAPNTATNWMNPSSLIAYNNSLNAASTMGTGTVGCTIPGDADNFSWNYGIFFIFYKIIFLLIFFYINKVYISKIFDIFNF